MAFFKENDRIAEYTLICRYEEDSFHELYLADDEREHACCHVRIFCMDTLPSSMLDRDGSVIEAEIASSLRHPNLCRLLSSGTVEKDDRKFLYIATETPGGDFLWHQVSEGKRFAADELARLMGPLLRALDCLHHSRRPVIHNAVTPENICFDGRTCDFSGLKLTGFENARYSDLGPDPLLWHGQDLHYVAPERMEGGGSVRSDIFSAGAVMYWLVFGIRPWETKFWREETVKWALELPEEEAGSEFVQSIREDVRSFIEKRKGPLPIPEKRLIDIDDAQLEAMRKALSADPEKRFQSAPEFMDALGIKEQPYGSDEVLSQGACSQDSDPGEASGAEQKEASGNTPEPRRARGNGFADVAGMEDLKSMMREKIIDVLKEPELAEKYRIQIPNGMLLYGPPGCGKSFIAEKFSEEAGWNYKLIKSSDLASTYVHGSQEKIGALFDEARKNAPMILNFDEFDALVPDRGRSESVHRSSEVNEFLSQMNNCGKDRVFVIASSNRPDLIDPAVRRKGRLDQMIYIPVPDAAAREGMFRVQMKGRPQEEGIDFGHLASLTENYVAADIAFIVNDAAEKAFRSRTDITERMLEEAIKKTPPSVGPDDIRYYESLREKIEKSAKESAHNPIGFIQK
ncbi:MAG: AAA family ATPase [Pseudomonadota bacterium]|nr:AAA family ATPase [Pseudomonadota bacterium]